MIIEYYRKSQSVDSLDAKKGKSMKSLHAHSVSAALDIILAVEETANMFEHKGANDLSFNLTKIADSQEDILNLNRQQVYQLLNENYHNWS